MKKLLYILALMAFGGSAHAATTYYVSDCGTGASAQCVAGNDSNAGTAPTAPWKSCDKVTSKFPSLAAGDQVLFARGSAQTACKLSYLSNLNSRAANPIVIGAYTPSWATASSPVPILRANTSTDTLSLMNSGNSTHDEGYIIQDLHFVGPGPGSTVNAVMMSNDVKYVTIQRIEIEQYALGIYCNGGTNNPLAAGSNGLTEHIVIRNSNIHHNRGMGILAGCNDLLIGNNTLDNNGVGMLDHHIYIGGNEVLGVEQTVTQVVIRGNKLTNNSPYASSSAASPTPGGCGGVAIVTHGVHDGLIIENNTVIEPIPSTNAQCWGISVDGGYSKREGFTNVAIRGNTVVNYGVGIGVDLCDTCTVENNYVYSEAPAPSGIVAPSKYFETPLAGDTLNNKLTVRNNTVYLKSPTFGSVGIRLSRDGTGHTITSNLVYFGSGSTSATSCFYTSGLPTSAFAAFDYNMCYFSATAGTWDAARGSLASQRAAGFDAHSLTTNPGISAPVAPAYSLAVGSGSPAVQAGHPSLSSKFAIGGLQRAGTPDIGAFQVGASVVVPSAPTSLGIQ